MLQRPTFYCVIITYYMTTIVSNKVEVDYSIYEMKIDGGKSYSFLVSPYLSL